MKRALEATWQRKVWKADHKLLQRPKASPRLAKEAFPLSHLPEQWPRYPQGDGPRLIRQPLMGLLMIFLTLGLSGLLWAADSQPSKPSPKAPPQITAPGHADFIKTNGSHRPSKDSPQPQEGTSASGSRSCSSEDRTGRPYYRYYHYYYGPYWPGYPWPYPPPPPPVYIPYGPIFVDPDTAGYGPRSVLRMMGVEHWFSRPPSTQPSHPQRPSAPNQPPHGAGGAIGQQQQEAPKPPNPPNLNPPLILEGPGKAQPGQGDAGAGNQNPAQPAARNPERAMLLVDLGDAHFAHKKYAEALQRYREAARLDPQLPEAHLHMGFALVAVGKYAEAAQAFKQGLQLHPNWPASGFRLQGLYGPQEAERVAHRNALAGAVATKPNDPDLLFLLGLLFYFDQMPDQARRFFTEAARLTAPNTAHLDPFLRRL